MSIKAGNNNIMSIYTQGRLIKKVYVGSNLVFNKTNSPIDNYAGIVDAFGNSGQAAKEMYNNLPELVTDQAKVILMPFTVSQRKVFAMDNSNGELIGLDFSRSSQATFYDPNLNMQLAGNDMPRIDYGNYSNDAKILMEKENTNIVIIYPETKNYKIWSGSVQNINYGLRITSSGSSGIYWTNEVIKDLINYSFSFSFQKVSGILTRMGGHYSNTNIQILNSTINGVDCNWLSGGQFIDNYDLRKVEVIFKKIADDSVAVLYIQPNRSAPNANVTDLLYIQIEYGNVCTSYIPTTDSQVTRSKEQLSYTLLNDCSVYLNSTKQKVVLDKPAGIWAIHDDLDNEGIICMAIFDRVLTEDEKQLIII